MFTVIGNGASSLIQIDSAAATTGTLSNANLSATNELGATARSGPHWFAPIRRPPRHGDQGALAGYISTIQWILNTTSSTPIFFDDFSSLSTTHATGAQCMTGDTVYVYELCPSGTSRESTPFTASSGRQVTWRFDSMAAT